MNKLFVVVLALFLSTALFAQTARDSVAVYGNVMDSFTHEMLKGVRITIMLSDSTVVAEHTSDTEYRYGGYKHNFDAPGYLYLRRKDYIFRFAKEGYTTQYLNLPKRKLGSREQRRFLGEIFLVKKPKDKVTELNEVEVRASKIRMVVKGDTIVYNADAFELAQGSMLDGLIKKLPGFELRDGQIRVNGTYVSSLLVNGEDFFRGDPRVALENLPAYMVHKVKTYRREPEWNSLTQEKLKRENLPLVVDVSLKREYATGWVGNVGVGYGTEGRYMGRLFGLRFDDRSRLALYGNANNTNDAQEAGASGDWRGKGSTSGQTEMQTAGLELLLKGDKNRWKYLGHAKLYHRQVDDESSRSVETFQPTLRGNTFGRSRHRSEGNEWRVQTEHSYELNKANVFAKVVGSLAYRHNNSEAWEQGTELSHAPRDSYRSASLDSLLEGSSLRLERMLIHLQQEKRLSREHLATGRLSASSTIKIPHTPDYLQLSLNTQVEHRGGSTFNDYLLRYGQGVTSPSANEHQKRHRATPEWRVEARLRAEYAYRLDWTSLYPYIEFEESYHEGESSLYRFDRLGSNAPDLGKLPSTTAALLRSLDASNSYTLESNALSTKVGTRWVIWLGGKLPSHRLSIEPLLHWQIDKLGYERDVLRVHPHRSRLLFTPRLSWGFDNCDLKYEVHTRLPNLLSLQDYVDSSDPLNLYQGNPKLRASTTHSLRLQRSWHNRKKSQNLKLLAQWSVTDNAIAQGQSYDEARGVRTFMPRNVSGNWQVSLGVAGSTPLDTKQKTLLSAETQADYHNSVDYVS